MTPELIDTRIIELLKMEESLKNQILQAQANLQAVSGAKEDCRYWLDKFKEEAAKAVAVTKTPLSTNGEDKMAKNIQQDSKLVNQHKRMAQGDKITGMKKGGKACMKKGGKVKKGKK